MNIKPWADRVLILPAPAEEKTIGGIRNDDTANCLFFGWCWSNQHSICQWFNIHSYFDFIINFQFYV